MEGLLLFCLGLIGYLFYQTSGQRNKLSTLQSQLYKLQQQFNQLQQQMHNKLNSTVIEAHTEPVAKAAIPIALEAEAEAEIDKEPLPTTTPEPPIVADNSKAEPTVIEHALSQVTLQVKNYFTQGNQIVRIGIVVLFFGMSFLAKYSIENSLVSIEVRMAGILIAALIMLAIGWKLRIKNPAYGLIMQGGGIAISYISIFASFKLYQLIPAEFTFPLLIVFSLAAMSLAVLQNAKALAVTAMAGGFAAPILASTGHGSHVSLFSYYLVLNCAIFFVAWFKSWRLLNVIGFLFTFIIASIWGVTQYHASQFSTTEPFLIAFFLIYVAISILFSIKQKPELKGYVDGTLVFGVPMVGFGLQSALVNTMEYGLAYSAASLAIFYFLVTYLLKKKARIGQESGENLQLMSQAMFALGIIFATLTIPFALDGRWSAASWAIEGAGFVWIALRQQREILKYVGLALQFLGGLLFLADYPYNTSSWAFMNAEFMGIAIISLSGLFTARILQQAGIDESPKQKIDKPVASGLIIWGIVWWYFGGLIQVEEHLSIDYELVAYVAFVTVSAALWLMASLRWQWQQANFFPWLLLLPLCLYFWPTIFNAHFFADYGYIVWPSSLALLYGIFYYSDKAKYSLFKPTALHAISYLLVLSISAYEASWYINDLKLADAWLAIAVMTVLIIGLYAINKYQRWPFKYYAKAYYQISSVVIIAGMMIWGLGFNFLTVLEARPIPYLPLLNPIDLILLAAVLTAVQWYRLQGYALFEDFFAKKSSTVAMGLLASFSFVWFNVLLLKTIHVVTGIHYEFEALFGSAIVQTTLSIAWTVLGLLIMILASKKSIRQLWFTGAALTAVVVAKLFLLDLAGQGTIERIISFIVVGALLLVVGYFSPMPPKLAIEESILDEASASE